jgi:DNA-binding CsgD family transcriptional regulator
VIFVDDMLRVVQVNRSAETMLAQGDPVRVESGRLVVRSDAANTALAAAVSDARDESGMAHRGIGIPLRRNDGEPCIIHVLPLTRGNLRPGLSGGAVAALFISAVSSPRNLPTDAVAFLYDLTPAEAHIFELICRGMTQERIADRLGIAGSTVKTHLRSVFAKTGCRRQVDLVKLGLGVALPL